MCTHGGRCWFSPELQSQADAAAAAEVCLSAALQVMQLPAACVVNADGTPDSSSQFCICLLSLHSGFPSIYAQKGSFILLHSSFPGLTVLISISISLFFCIRAHQDSYHVLLFGSVLLSCDEEVVQRDVAQG